VWICGDCHLGNLGPVADTKGRVAIQIRDVDQTVIGNPAHDIIRLGLSLASTARSSNLPGITTAKIIEQVVDGYEAALVGELANPKDKSHRPKSMQKLLKNSIKRKWRHLALERFRTNRAVLRPRKVFWPLRPEERLALVALFNEQANRDAIARLTTVQSTDALELVDAAYWIKGCSSLGRLRYAVILEVGEGKSASLCLIDIKQAVTAAAPRAAEAAMPKDEATRIIAGAKALSPNLGDRMIAARFLGASLVLRELKPQDLKVDVGRLTQEETMALSRYLAGVVGRAHGRQMDADTRKSWHGELARARSATLDAPSWVWASVVDLVAAHEGGYLNHCRLVTRTA